MHYGAILFKYTNMGNIQEKYTKIIVDFLKSHEAISVNYIENQLSIPTGTISRALNGHKLIPKKYIYPLLCVLSSYGIEIDEYRLIYDETIDSITFMRIGEKVASYEVIDNGNGDELIFEITEDYDNTLMGSSYFYSTYEVYTDLYTNYNDLP